MTLRVWKITDHLLYRMFLNLGLMFSHDLVELCILGQNNTEVINSFHRHVMSIWLFTVEADIDYLVKLGSGEWLHCEVTIVSF